METQRFCFKRETLWTRGWCLFLSFSFLFFSAVIRGSGKHPPRPRPSDSCKMESPGSRPALTSFLSFRFVSMTMVVDFCSQTILQKSLTVSCLGPVSGRRPQSQRQPQGEVPAGPSPWHPSPGTLFSSFSAAHEGWRSRSRPQNSRTHRAGRDQSVVSSLYLFLPHFRKTRGEQGHQDPSGS